MMTGAPKPTPNTAQENKDYPDRSAPAPARHSQHYEPNMRETRKKEDSELKV